MGGSGIIRIFSFSIVGLVVVRLGKHISLLVQAKV